MKIDLEVEGRRLLVNGYHDYADLRPRGKPLTENGMARRRDRDIEKGYTVQQMVAKLRRLADCLEKGRPFHIQIAGERLSIPTSAVFNIEHEREGINEEVEFQFKWERK